MTKGGVYVIVFKGSEPKLISFEILKNFLSFLPELKG